MHLLAVIAVCVNEILSEAREIKTVDQRNMDIAIAPPITTGRRLSILIDNLSTSESFYLTVFV